MSFNLLPAEVLECILAYLDGVSFCVAKQVCKTWSKICKQIELGGGHWRTLCVRQIPMYIIEELLASNSVPPNQSVICWLSLFRKWLKGKISSNPKDFKKISIEATLTNPITCMKVSGSFVITGHNNGYISVWNNETGELDQEFMCHLKTITDIVLLDQVKLGTYFYRDELFWSHHHLITVSKDCIIRLKFLLEPLDNSENDLVLNKHGDIILSARVFGDKLFVYSRDNTISFWKLKTYHAPFLLLDIQFLHTIIGPADLALSVGLWCDQLFCISKAGNLRLCNIEENTWSELTYFRNCWSERRDLVAKCYNFRNKIILLVTVSGDMIISVNEENYRLYGMTPFLRTSITSLALKGTILAIGGENGMLYLFYVPNNKSLVQITKMTSKIYLSEASIIAIDILFEIDCPIVVASTTNSIYVIRLQKSGTPIGSCAASGSTNKYLASTSTCT